MFGIFWIVLLSLFFFANTLSVHAMWLYDYDQDLYDQSQALAQREEWEQSSRLNTLLTRDHLFMPENFIEQLIGMDENFYHLSDEEKRASIHTLRSLFDERSGLNRDAVKLSLKSLCNKVNEDFKNLSLEKKDAYSIQELQALFERSVNYKTQMQILTEKFKKMVTLSDDGKEVAAVLVGIALSGLNIAIPIHEIRMLTWVATNILSLCRIKENDRVVSFVISYNAVLFLAVCNFLQAHYKIPLPPMPFISI